MKRRATALSVAVVVLVSACTQSATTGPAPGAVVDVAPEVAPPLYSPVDREALAFGLPELVQGIRLDGSPATVIDADEDDFAHDLAVRRILVENAIGPSAVTIEHKGDDHAQLPNVAVSAVQIRGVPAIEFADFDPSFYLLLTSVTKEQWDWVGDKPGPQPATIGGRDVQLTDWTESGFQVAWYTLGDVLYIVMARNPQLLEAALRQMPQLPGTV